MEISQEEWEQWLQHPVTALFRGHLRDQGQSLADQWSRGRPLDSADQGRAQAFYEAAEIDYQQMREFYEGQ